MMNSKSRVKVFISANTIEINKVFEKMCQKPNSDEYALLQKLRAENSQFEVKVRTINSNKHKQTYHGLNYEFMRNYIITETPEKDKVALLHKFDKLIRVSKCQAKSRRYPVIKKWFLDRFPEIAEFGITAEAIENEEVTAIEEAIEDEEVIETEETMDIAEAPAVSKAA